ncbi:MAG: glycosyltransferase family 9 protein [Anaerolineae bacterium]|nr:glycosyltransferase family 9 protein [Anaerolineae bacterium]
MSAPPERILVVKLADLGDALTATPALRALRETYPQARVDVLTSPAGAVVLGNLPGVAHIIEADRHLLDSPAAWVRPRTWQRVAALARGLSRADYDCLLLMHHLSSTVGALKWRVLVAAVAGARSVGLDNGRGRFLDVRVEDRGFAALHEVEYGLQLAAAVGASCSDHSLQLQLPQDASERADALLAPIKGYRYVTIHPGSGDYSPARRWFPERFAAVADELSSHLGLAVVLVGGPRDDVESVRALMSEPSLDLSRRTDIPTLAAILSRSALFLGGDSGVMHLATAAGAPVLALFGPTDARAWGPWRPPMPGAAPVSVLQGVCPWRGPCLYVGHSVGRRHGCPTRDCLRSIQVQDVLERADAIVHR